MTQEHTSQVASIDDIPPDIQHLAQETQLGKLRKVYNARRTTRREIGLGLILGSSVFWGLGALMLILVIELADPETRLSLLLEIALPFILPGLLLLLPGCYLLFHHGTYAHWRVYLYEKGFIYEKGIAKLMFPWDRIARVKGQVKAIEVTHAGRRGHTYTEIKTLYSYHIHDKSGEKVELTNAFPDIAELVDIILEEVTCRLAPPEVRLSPPDSAVTFNDFTLDHEGIGSKQAKLPWREVREIAIHDGSATIHKREE